MAAMLGILAIVAFVALDLYFGSRASGSEPSRWDRGVAMAWLVFRRIVCFFAAFLALLAMGIAVLRGPMSWELLAICCLTMLFVAFLVRVGMYGHERKRNSLEDDMRQHEAHKARYRWRW